MCRCAEGCGPPTLVTSLSECNRHHIGIAWRANPYWVTSEYGGWDEDYECESPPPSPPPAPPTPPPATPDWTGDRHSIWFCGVHLWPESARRRPQQGGQHPPHSGMDYERTHYALEQLHGYAAAG